MAGLDFDGLNQLLLSRHHECIPKWLPAARLKGKEYEAGSLQGNAGQSLKINSISGAWCDFATDEKGGDLISLYAAINQIPQGDAAKELARQHDFPLNPRPNGKSYLPQPAPNRLESAPPAYPVPPENAPQPSMLHPEFGSPSKSWAYRDGSGRVVFYVARYEPEEHRKSFLPWSWDGTSWRARAIPEPRPLLNLPFPDGRPILIVEGEKTADAAREIAGRFYHVTTWSSGARAHNKTDFSPCHGRRVLLWPDADQPGTDAMEELAARLAPNCLEVKIIYPADQPDGWDAADALADGMSCADFVAWAKPIAVLVEPPVEPEPEPPPVEMTPETTSCFAMWQRLGLAMTDKGAPICNEDNVLRILESHPKLKTIIWYDEFLVRVLTTWNSETHREWTDADDVAMTTFLQRDLNISRMSVTTVRNGIQVFVQRNKKNSARDWMDSLVWDQKPRISEFFVTHLGAPQSEYAESASHNFWVSMVARIYQPGAQVDSMVILEGPQGAFKSTALRLIGGPWYAESNESVTSKDFFLFLQGKLLVEISELDAFNRAETNTIKKVITCKTDRYRVPYGRNTADFPRQCVFVGTTNDEQYLRDQTGNRRFWPVRVGHIDVARIKDDRDQLYAEAVHRYKAGEPWHEMPAEATRLEQQERTEEGDPWEDFIGDYIDSRPTLSEIRAKQIATEILEIDSDRITNWDYKRIAKVLRRLGWERHRTKNDGHSQRNRVWKRVDSDQPSETTPTDETNEIPF